MNKKIALFAATALLALPLAPVLAEDSIAAQPERIMQRQENQELRDQNKLQRNDLKDQREKNTQDRCANIQTRLNEKISKYESSKIKFTVSLTNMQNRLQRLSERLQSKGVDVTKLNADIATLSEKITKLKKDHEAFVTGLRETATIAPEACGNSKGEFMGKLIGARKTSQLVQQDRLEIKQFFQTTIKADIMAIRKELEKKNTEQNTVTEDEKTETDATKKAL